MKNNEPVVVVTGRQISPIQNINYTGINDLDIQIFKSKIAQAIVENSQGTWNIYIMYVLNNIPNSVYDIIFNDSPREDDVIALASVIYYQCGIAGVYITDISVIMKAIYENIKSN